MSSEIQKTYSPAASGGATARQRSIRRKAIYLVAIIVLIVAILALGLPGHGRHAGT